MLEAGSSPDAGVPADTAQALGLARAGHRVIVLEPDPAIRKLVRETLDAEPEAVRKRVRLVDGDGQETGAHFLPGTFDVVLCHGVLMGARDPASTLAGFARVLAPGGLLSVLIRNDAALALHPGRAGDWSAALAAFDFAERVFRLEPMSALLAGIGAPLRAWYGVQVFEADGTGAAGTAAADPRRLAAEERAGRTDPYRGVAAHLHLCGVRAGVGATRG